MAENASMGPRWRFSVGAPGAWQGLRGGVGALIFAGAGVLLGLIIVAAAIRLAVANEPPALPESAPEAAAADAGDADDPAEAAADGEDEVQESALPGVGSVTAIPINREWEVLTPPATPDVPDSLHATLARVGELLGDWQIFVAGVRITGPGLLAIAEGAPEEPLLRRVREELRRPFDLLDLLYFFDDVLVAGDRGLRGKRVWVPSGRARSAGITIHPDDVFKKNAPRRYAAEPGELNIDKPKRPANLPPAKDGDRLGPEWSARFRNPGSPKAMLAALAKENESGTYVERIKSLRRQVRDQGGSFYLYTTVRNRHRGYLMWGAFMLSRRTDAGSLRAGVKRLERLNRQWGLNVPILWRHADGWKANIEAAREMSDAYDVVYATENGARNSNHYGGNAVDLAGFALPRSFTLEAPDGATQTFDLADPQQSRDINLTPEIIRFIEAHFQMKKLIFDYPHWDDVAAHTPRRK